MGVRDEEIKRIIKYAAGLGVKVTLKPYVGGEGGGGWSWVDQEIEIYTSKNQTKTSIILVLLHELGHHIDFMYKDQHIAEITKQAFRNLNKGNMFGPRPDLSQIDRDIILEDEKEGISYMSLIYTELNLGIPKWKVKLAQEMDIYDYTMLAKKGRFATGKEYNDHAKKIKPRIRRKYGK